MKTSTVYKNRGNTVVTPVIPVPTFKSYQLTHGQTSFIYTPTLFLVFV